MENDSSSLIKNAVDLTIRLGFLLLLIAWCLMILYPFLSPVLWGVIIAVSLQSLYERLKNKLGNRKKLSATIITIFFLCIILIPGYLMFESLVDGLKTIGSQLENGEFKIPPPKADVKDWPVIGNKLYVFWDLSSQNLDKAMVEYKEQISAFGHKMVSAFVGVGTGILMLALSIIIAGILLVNSEGGGKIAKKVFRKIVGEKGDEFTEISIITIKNVTKGILGVAFIQAALVGLGFVFAGVPYAGLWALLVLILAIVQLPATIVVLPVVVYLFSAMSTVGATLWAIYLLVAGASDNILKPILLGKGAPVPMLVVFLGAIGGFMVSGFAGLFTGAIVLTLGYKLFLAWIKDEENTQTSETGNTAGSESG